MMSLEGTMMKHENPTDETFVWDVCGVNFLFLQAKSFFLLKKQDNTCQFLFVFKMLQTD